MQNNNNKKISTKAINAIAHNLLIDKVLRSAWDFVCSLHDETQFDYAFVNSAVDYDYCDTTWHATQNSVIDYSMLQNDTQTMYDSAKTNFVNACLNVNLATLTPNSIYKALDSISGDTAMRDDYYAKLSSHFAQFARDNAQHFTFTQCPKYSDDYNLNTVITARQKKQLVHDFVQHYNLYDSIQLNNTISS